MSDNLYSDAILTLNRLVDIVNEADAANLKLPSAAYRAASDWQAEVDLDEYTGLLADDDMMMDRDGAQMYDDPENRGEYYRGEHYG